MINKLWNHINQRLGIMPKQSMDGGQGGVNTEQRFQKF